MSAVKQNNTLRFYELRKKHKVFYYNAYHIDIKNDALEISYEFSIEDGKKFTPGLKIPVRNFFIKEHLNIEKLDNLAFHIGLIELISYWKSSCPPLICIKPYYLTEEQVQWWKNLYFQGLGEFFYLNGIESNQHDFLNIVCEGTRQLHKPDLNLRSGTLVPVGGGKDSALTLELLKERDGLIPMSLNTRQAISGVIAAAGFGKHQCIEMFRTLDPALLELNKLGYLNGHTPFSALLAFESLLASALCGVRNIALSNESSANEPTIPGTLINHQYSKSYAFEASFRAYVRAYISDEINYYSFLRPLHELQIARLFSDHPEYFASFKSCNAGSKNDMWCCNCPKCMFSYIILYPFLEKESLLKIFGSDLFEMRSLQGYFDELCGLADEKPFECVGTIAEVNLALYLAVRKNNGRLPFLLDHYVHSGVYSGYSDAQIHAFIHSFDEQNFLNNEHIQILKNALQCLND